MPLALLKAFLNLSSPACTSLASSLQAGLTTPLLLVQPSSAKATELTKPSVISDMTFKAGLSFFCIIRNSPIYI